MQRFITLISLALCALLTACTSMPAHNNTLIFAVQKTVGLEVNVPTGGTGAGVALGYKQTDFAWVPLWANDAKGSMPCSVNTNERVTKSGGSSTTVTVSEIEKIDCAKGPKFLADSESAIKSGDAHDAYSTFSSFGGDFGGGGGTQNGAQVEAKGRMASFFATGVAAQHLAKRPESVGLPSATSDETNKKSVSWEETMRDFLENTAPANRSVTVTVTVSVSTPTSSSPSTSSITTTQTTAIYLYTPECAQQMGKNAALMSAELKKLETYIAKNIKVNDLLKAINADNALNAKRENLASAAKLLKIQIDNGKKANQSAPENSVCPGPLELDRS